MTENIEVAIKEANSALPVRKINSLIERTTLSADMKQIASGSDGSGAYSAAVFTIDNQFVITDQIRLDPSISYTDADGTDTNYVTYGATLSYDVSDSLAIYAGVRNINYDTLNKETTTTTLSLKTLF